MKKLTSEQKAIACENINKWRDDESISVVRASEVCLDLIEVPDEVEIFVMCSPVDMYVEQNSAQRVITAESRKMRPAANYWDAWHAAMPTSPDYDAPDEIAMVAVAKCWAEDIQRELEMDVMFSQKPDDRNYGKMLVWCLYWPPFIKTTKPHDGFAGGKVAMYRYAKLWLPK